MRSVFTQPARHKYDLRITELVASSPGAVTVICEAMTRVGTSYDSLTKESVEDKARATNDPCKITFDRKTGRQVPEIAVGAKTGDRFMGAGGWAVDPFELRKWEESQR